MFCPRNVVKISSPYFSLNSMSTRCQAKCPQNVAMENIDFSVHEMSPFSKKVSTKCHCPRNVSTPNPATIYWFSPSNFLINWRFLHQNLVQIIRKKILQKVKLFHLSRDSLYILEMDCEGIFHRQIILS